MADNYINLPVQGSGGGGGGGAVDSFNGRTGVVVSAPGDYNAGQVTNTPAGNISATNVQNAINELDAEKQANITGAASTVVTANLTADRAVISNGAGKIAVSPVTSTELGYSAGVTSSIQTQLDNKQPLDSDLTAIAALATTGLIARTGSGTASTRSVAAGANISVSDGDGVAGNPTVSLSGTVPIANGGTGTAVAPTNGQLLIGNAGSYSVSSLSAGAGINVTPSAGGITITNTALTSSINLDGGSPSTVYGGISPIDGGNP